MSIEWIGLSESEISLRVEALTEAIDELGIIKAAKKQVMKDFGKKIEIIERRIISLSATIQTKKEHQERTLFDDEQ